MNARRGALGKCLLLTLVGMAVWIGIAWLVSSRQKSQLLESPGPQTVTINKPIGTQGQTHNEVDLEAEESIAVPASSADVLPALEEDTAQAPQGLETTPSLVTSLRGKVDHSTPPPDGEARTDSDDDEYELSEEELAQAAEMASRNLPSAYIPPAASHLTKIGRPIVVDYKLLTRLKIPPKSFQQLTREAALDFVFVTGSPSRYFIHSMDTVAGIQKYFPGYKILYYDLGLTKEERQKARSWCNVQLREMDKTAYPPHVYNYRNMAYKPLIISELMRTHNAVLWMDPHFRAFKGNWTHVFDTILKNDGIFLFKCTGIPGYVTTDPKLYSYFPANTELYKTVGDYWAGGMYVFKSQAIYWNIIYWWTICALDPGCAEPSEAYICGDWGQYVDRQQPENTGWAQCHRFGQSVVSLLINNQFGYRRDAFTEKTADPVASVIRAATWLHDLQYCDT